MAGRILCLVTLFGLLAVALSVPVGAGQYRAVELQMLPGATSAEACSINDNGQIVGYCQVGYQERAVAWDASGAARDLSLVAGADQSRATSINNGGEIVVITQVGQYESRSVVIQDNAVVRSWPDQGVSSRMVSISESGQMVGLAYDGSRNYAAQWGGEGVVELLPGAVPGVHLTYANDVNDNGWSVGYFHDYAHYTHNRACLWRSPTEMDYILGDTEVDSEAKAVNDIGQIVGTAYTAEGTNEAFLWHNGIFRYLAKPDGITWANANGINNAGQIVGDFGLLIEGDFDPIYSRDAYIWENGLFQLLPSAYGYSEAVAVNNMGWAVGSASYSTEGGDWPVRAMLWMPVPEPSGLLALAAGLGCLTSVLRCKAGISQRWEAKRHAQEAVVKSTAAE